MGDDISLLLDGETVKCVQTTDVYVPKGWSRFISMRTGGASAGKYDVCYYSPKGKKLRSKQELKNYIERHNLEVKAEEFIFASGINRRKKANKPDDLNPAQKRIKKPKPPPKKIELCEDNNSQGSGDLEEFYDSLSSGEESSDSLIDQLVDAGILPKKKHPVRRRKKESRKLLPEEEQEEFQSLGLVLESNEDELLLEYYEKISSQNAETTTDDSKKTVKANS